jgi:hypothetical protein
MTEVDPLDTRVSLFEHIKSVVALSQASVQGDVQRLEARLFAAEQAVTLADKVLGIRLEHANNTLAHMEIQQKEAGLQLAKQAAEFARREEVSLQVQSLADKLEDLNSRYWKLAMAAAAAGGTAGAAITKFFL